MSPASGGAGSTTTFIVQRSVTTQNRRNTHDARQRKMVIRSADGKLRVEAPYAPQEVQHSALNDEWVTVNRSGRLPLLLRRGKQLRTQSFTLFVGHRDIDHNVQPTLGAIIKMSRSRRPVYVSFSRFETRAWRITSLSMRSMSRRAVTNEITRAEVDIEFTVASDLNIHVGPVTGGHNKGGGGGKGGGKGTPRYYVWKKGDTLHAIAIRFYQDARKWRTIADANHIKRIRHIKVGRRLRLP